MNNLESAANAYETHAMDFAGSRDRSTIGVPEIKQWASMLPKKATVIDLGCGSGYPLTKVLNDFDFQVWALDSSPTLIKLFQTRFPHIPIQCEPVQKSHFFNQKFDAAMAVGLIFLLTEKEQRAFINDVSKALKSGGRFLFSAPSQTAHWKDVSTGCESRSLGQKRYVEVLDKTGFRLLSTFRDAGNNLYYDAALT